MKKILFVTRCLEQKKSDGGLVVSNRNLKLLFDIYGKDNVDIFEVRNKNKINKLFSFIFNQSYNITFKDMKTFKRIIKKENYDLIFFNSSLYDSFLLYSRKLKIDSLVFYHNIEYLYYKDMIINAFLGKLFCNYIKRHEKICSKKALYRVVLNQRDFENLFRIYKIKADLILPISMENKVVDQNYKAEKNCAFIGSNFFANIQGISWFIKNVAPFINRKLLIAGSICESVKDIVHNSTNIELLGYVNNIDDFYKNTDIIISPIFLGSGMKTKTIEALAYGKNIIGTEEAFVGIEADFNSLGGKCSTAQEFIEKINSFDYCTFNRYAYNLFNSSFSNDVVLHRLKLFLKE